MGRKDITMSDVEVAAFLEHGHTLQVATIGPSGHPHLAPMWFVVDDGNVVFRSFTKSQKIVNLARNPKLTVLVEQGEAYEELQGVMIQGTARLVDDRAYVLDIYGRLTTKYGFPGLPAGVELDPDALEQAFGRFAEKNTAVVVEADRIVTWDHTKLAGY